MEDINKFVKKGLELGIGMAYVTVDALNEAMKKLEKEGKISSKEGEKIVNETVRKYQAKSDRYTKEMRTQVDSLIKAMPFATKKDIESLNAKIDQLSKSAKKKRSRR